VTDTQHVLTPLERLDLRDSLQDQWRDQVRRITELSIELHTALGEDRENGFNRSASISFAIGEARMRLTEIEDEMRRLDVGGVGSWTPGDSG
jgi:hypothetical protein